MRKLTFIILALTAILATSCRQNTCTLAGTIEGGKDGDTILLITDMENGTPMDTLYIKEGKFSYQAEIDSTTLCFAQYNLNGVNIQAFFLEPGSIHLDIRQDASASHLSGTHLNDEWQKLNTAAYNYQKEMRLLTEQVQKDTSEANMQSVMSRVQVIQQKLSEDYYKSAEKNIGNELGYVLVTNPVALSEEQVLKLINQMPVKMRSRKEIKEIESYLRSTADAESETGTQLPNFSANDPKGKKVDAYSVISRHQLTIIDFWASWCGPCMQEMPHMVELYGLYKDKGLGILGVSLDTDGNAWRDAIAKTRADWTHISELKRDSEIARMFGVTAIPFTMVVDQEGTVLASGLVGNELEDFVRNELK